LLAEYTRADRVESVHYGAIAVVDGSGTLIASTGDPELFLYFRSSAKPFQAIPVVESGAADRFGLTARELALCCASHEGSIRHQTEVAAFLAKLGLTESALHCGIVMPGDENAFAAIQSGAQGTTPLTCDCSGKHSGMLATCLHLDYPIESYLDPAHPLQVTIKEMVAESCRVSVDSLVMATDGCSLPTFGSTLAAFARSYAELARPMLHVDALTRLRDAMIEVPENVSGDGNLVTELMRIGQGKIVCKSGAEGLICLGLPESGLGIAIRVADGSFRAHPVIVAEVLRQLDVVPRVIVDQLLAAFDPIIRNHNKWNVGQARPAFALS
jgi:L-asparaginase II